MKKNNPDATAFVGGPKKINPDESSILMLDTHRATIAVTGGPKKGKQVAIPGDRLILGREQPVDYMGAFCFPGHAPRATAVGSRAEALNAARRAALLLGRDPTPYEQALIRMAGFQIRNQYRGAATYWVPHPEKVDGAFRAGITDDEVRIDYVQHIVASMGDTLTWYDAPATSSSTPGR